MTDVDPIVETLVQTTGEIRRGFIEQLDETEETNPSGDTQLAADRWVDDVLFEHLAELDVVGTFASEERAHPVDVGEGYSVAIDPLDGSSNLLVNNTVGTIVGVYDAPLPARGRDLVAGMYVLYGPKTTMTLAVNEHVERCLIQGGSIVARSAVTIPDERAVCGFAGQINDWTESLEAFVDHVRQESKLRYTGAMVADVDQVLIQGGIAGYPALQSGPDGILRLQFESNPVAYIVEAAGGNSSTGHGSVLDLSPESLHQRTPTYFGNRELIAELESAL